MFYLILFSKVLILELLAILLHEILHLFASTVQGFKLYLFYSLPLRINKCDNCRFPITLSLKLDKLSSSHSSYGSVKLSSKLDYDLLLKKIFSILWIGPIFDLIIFLAALLLGITNANYLYLLLFSFLHFAISTYNFINTDGKYAIGAKEDTKIAYCLINRFTLIGSGYLNSSTKRIMTDKHMSITDNSCDYFFDVENLWHFENNLNFFHDSLLSYLNHDLLELNNKSTIFIESLINDYNKIKRLDYRQIEKTSHCIIIYLIFEKLKNPSFTIPDYLYNELKVNCTSNYHIALLDYYFLEGANENYLSKVENMPSIVLSQPGYIKLYKNLVTCKKSGL